MINISGNVKMGTALSASVTSNSALLSSVNTGASVSANINYNQNGGTSLETIDIDNSSIVSSNTMFVSDDNNMLTLGEYDFANKNWHIYDLSTNTTTRGKFYIDSIKGNSSDIYPIDYCYDHNMPGAYWVLKDAGAWSEMYASARFYNWWQSVDGTIYMTLTNVNTSGSKGAFEYILGFTNLARTYEDEGNDYAPIILRYHNSAGLCLYVDSSVTGTEIETRLTSNSWTDYLDDNNSITFYMSWTTKGTIEFGINGTDLKASVSGIPVSYMNEFKIGTAFSWGIRDSILSDIKIKVKEGLL